MRSASRSSATLFAENSAACSAGELADEAARLAWLRACCLRAPERDRDDDPDLAFERDPPDLARVLLDLAFVLPDFARELPDFARELPLREDAERELEDFARDPPEREPPDPEPPDFEPLDRDPPDLRCPSAMSALPHWKPRASEHYFMPNAPATTEWSDRRRSRPRRSRSSRVRGGRIAGPAPGSNPRDTI